MTLKQILFRCHYDYKQWHANGNISMERWEWNVSMGHFSLSRRLWSVLFYFTTYGVGHEWYTTCISLHHQPKFRRTLLTLLTFVCITYLFKNGPVKTIAAQRLLVKNQNKPGLAVDAEIVESTFSLLAGERDENVASCCSSPLSLKPRPPIDVSLQYYAFSFVVKLLVIAKKSCYRPLNTRTPVMISWYCAPFFPFLPCVLWPLAINNSSR